jgi:DNA-binding NarL/FixJ family response regulator
VIVVDDEVEVRRAYRAFFDQRPDFVLVGEAGDGDSGVGLWRQQRPDVTVMDLSMPGMSGVEAVRRICAMDASAMVVVVSQYADSERVVAALSAGACGYLMKSASMAALGQGLREAVLGRMPLASPARVAVVDRLHSTTAAADPAPWERVTPRESQVLQALATGATNAQIAQQLGVSRGSIKHYLAVMYARFQVTTRTELVIRALELGLIQRSAA